MKETPVADAPGKICVICGQDCTGQPRTRDPRGRYAHEACVAKLREKRGPTEEARVRASLEEDEPDHVLESLLDETASHRGAAASGTRVTEGTGGWGTVCPSCAATLAPDSRVCIDCGYDLDTGQQLKSRKTTRGRAAATGPVVQLLTSPAVVIMGLAGFFGLFFAVAFIDEKMARPYVAVATAWALGIHVMVLFAAFRRHLVHGLLALLVPLYALIFVFLVYEEAMLKFLVLVSVLAHGAAIYLIVSATLLPPV